MDCEEFARCLREVKANRSTGEVLAASESADSDVNMRTSGVDTATPVIAPSSTIPAAPAQRDEVQDKVLATACVPTGSVASMGPLATISKTSSLETENERPMAPRETIVETKIENS